MVEDCPYCELKVKNVEEHLESDHEDSGLWTFFLKSKTSIATGLLLLISLLTLLLFPSLSLAGSRLHIYRLFLALAIVVGGFPLAKHSLLGLIKEKKFTVDGLVVVASIGAVSIGYWGEAAVLVFLFSVAERLEDYSVFRSRRSLKELLDLSPPKARLLEDKRTKKVDPKEVDIGDVVIVKPGERIPVDGYIIEGLSAIDESPITGESVPKEKGPEEEVFAGTLNIDGLLKVETTRTSQGSTISKIVRLVEKAEEKKTKTEKFINRFARYYTPIVLLLSLGVATVPWFLFDGSFDFWFYRALILLVLSCPCAFVISTPVTMVSAMTKSAKRGVLIKGSVFIEKIKEADTVVFDKTGTLTTGEFTVTEVDSLGDMDEKEIVLVSSSLENNSNHPLAEAIIKHSKKMNGEENYEIEEFRSLTGAGIEGKIEDEKYQIGNPGLFDLDKETKKEISWMTSKGETVVVLGKEEKAIGLIGLKDTLQEGAEKTIAELKKHGIEPIMLTGDNEKTASAIAEELGMDRYIANVLPQEKLQEIERLQKNDQVIMVGDGVNDAPALVKSDVGVAMGAAGSDTAMESSDMALMNDDLSKLLYLFELSEKTMKVVKENVIASIGVKFTLAVLTFFGLVTLWIAVGIGDMGMGLLVTLNALLLERR